ncbi:MAG: hypothetical protein K2L07_13240 [Lachnospiraceae bacterium]|nr:hypothetical protein [Lachnospiraceae bacterium]
MANVYIVNLKDNRTNHDKNDDTKFKDCIKKEIIAIGWGDSDSRKERSFKAAFNNFKRMEKGDLVWTKNPKTKNEFYLLEVDDEEGYDYLENEKEYYIHEDKSFVRKVKKVKHFTNAESLPAGIAKKDIVARRTAEQVHRQFLIDATLDYVK